MTFPGTIESGKLLLDHRADFHSHLQSLEGKRVEVSVEKFRRKRSNPQNAWLWGVAIGMIAKETGHEPKEIYYALVHMFSPKVAVGRLVVAKRGSKLDTVEFGDNMMEKVVRWAAEDLNMVIPMPPEKVTV